jgi:hypothetical protein
MFVPLAAPCSEIACVERINWSVVGQRGTPCKSGSAIVSQPPCDRFGGTGDDCAYASRSIATSAISPCRYASFAILNGMVRPAPGDERYQACSNQFRYWRDEVVWLPRGSAMPAPRDSDMVEALHYGAPRRVWVVDGRVFVEGHDGAILTMAPEVAIALGRMLETAGTESFINKVLEGKGQADEPP